jgi:hypothetical protein
MNNIKKGDRVKYVDTDWCPKGKTIKVDKFGIWDGEKVILEDKERTTVRNKEWLENMEEPKRLSDWDGDGQPWDGHMND